MEALIAIHRQTVSIPIQRLLKIFGTREFIQPFYLAGGTGLALQLGHRRSDDLVFFSATDEVNEATRQRIVAALADAQLQVLEAGLGSLYLLIDGVRVSFHAYVHPQMDELRQVDGVPIAGITDIGLMKLDALITCGRSKDIYDLYAIPQHIPLGQLLERGREKYPMRAILGCWLWKVCCNLTMPIAIASLTCFLTSPGQRQRLFSSTKRKRWEKSG